MKTDDSIFSLVHSLNTSEKRFLKRFGSSSSEDAHFLTLFSLIERQKEYDEKELQGRMKKEGVDNFSWTKNYLSKQILRSLRTYHSGPSMVLEVIDLLKSVEILFRKLQHKTCMKLIRKGIEICTAYEFWYYHLEFIDWEYRLMARVGNYKNLIRYLDEGKKEKEKVLARILLYKDVLNLIYLSDLLINQLSGFSPKEIDKITTDTVAEANKALKKAGESFRLREHLYYVLSSCYTVRIESRQELLYRDKLLKLYEAFPQFKNDAPFKYYSAAINTIYSLTRNEHYEKALTEISKLRAFIFGAHKTIKTDMQLHALSGLMRNETACYLALGEEGKALEVAAAFEPYRSKLRKNLRKVIVLNDAIFLARVYFRNRMYDKCKSFLREIFLETTVVLNPEIIIHANLLRIGVNIMQEKTGNVAHFISLTKKEIAKPGAEDPYITLFLDVVSDFVKNDGKINDKEKYLRDVAKLEKLIHSKNKVNDDLQFFLRELVKAGHEKRN